jgi:hypothetical protein
VGIIGLLQAGHLERSLNASSKGYRCSLAFGSCKTRGFSRTQAGFPVFQEHGTFGLG